MKNCSSLINVGIDIGTHDRLLQHRVHSSCILRSLNNGHRREKIEIACYVRVIYILR